MQRENLSNICQRWLLQIGFVLVFWLLAFSFLWKFTPAFMHSTVPIPSVFFQNPLPDNEIGKFAVWRHVADNKGQKYALAFDKMKVSNGKLGIFQTALYQTASFENLRLQVISSSHEGANDLLTENTISYDLKETDGIENIGQILTSQTNTLRDHMPDISRTVRFKILDFKFNHFLDTQSTPSLIIHSKLASFNIESPNTLTLQGHVKLEKPSALIETHTVRWNLDTQTFEIDGHYVRTVNDHKEHGKDICLNTNLETVKHMVKKNTEGREVCLAN